MPFQFIATPERKALRDSFIKLQNDIIDHLNDTNRHKQITCWVPNWFKFPFSEYAGNPLPKRQALDLNGSISLVSSQMERTNHNLTASF